MNCMPMLCYFPTGIGCIVGFDVLIPDNIPISSCRDWAASVQHWSQKCIIDRFHSPNRIHLFFSPFFLLQNISAWLISTFQFRVERITTTTPISISFLISRWGQRCRLYGLGGVMRRRIPSCQNCSIKIILCSWVSLKYLRCCISLCCTFIIWNFTIHVKWNNCKEIDQM